MTDQRLRDAFDALTTTMTRLRRDCPWDRVQTHASLRRYLIEESHEVLAALDAEDAEELCGELGDLLFQVWFHAEVASEADGGFDMADVLESVNAKLVRRHPHVFGDGEAQDGAAVRRSWEQIKRSEGRRRTFETVPHTLPALLLSQVLQEKAAGVGFDWPTIEGPLAKLREEIGELEEAARVAADGEPSAEMVHEFGDLLFAMVNTGRHLGLNAEDALREATGRFRSRFEHIEDSIERQGKMLGDVPLEELDRLWDEAKSAEG